MKKTAVASILFLLTANLPAQSPAPLPQSTPDFSAASAAINTAIAEKKLPGAVLVVGHNGQIVFEQAYGVRKYAGEPGLDGKPSPAEPMTEDTIFDMASLTKCLATATAIMQLYEAHKLDLDDPVVKYLPEFAANGKEHVTIRELLTHYSGLPPDVNLKDAWGLAAPDKAEGIKRAMESPLTTAPGTHFEYSDITYITLGLIVEKLSGVALDVYAQEHIFAPLGMKDTTYHSLGRVCPHGFLSLGSAALLDMNHAELDLKTTKIEDYCAPGTWNTESIFKTAPTQHDNEGTPETNPDFDHLLRGTVHDPTTRRMGGVAGQAGVFSTAEDISKFAQALLDKLLYDKGPFPLKQSTLKLMTTPEQPSTAQPGATIFTPDGKTTTGIAVRGFGWDINSAYSRPRGSVFPIGSFGHTGFTGTSLWMDPSSDTYIVLLANAIHPRGNPPISPLRGEVATDVANALGLAPHPQSVILSGARSAQSKDPDAATAATAVSTFLTPTSSGIDCAAPNTFCDPTKLPRAVQTGIDVLESTNFTTLKDLAAKHRGHLRTGLLTNQTGLDAQGRRTIDILRATGNGIELTKLFSPEHGIFGAKDSTEIGQETDPATGLKVISLYGPKDSDKRPKPEDLKDLDAVVIDLQDAGVRFYTYETVVGYFLEAAACEVAHEHPLEIIVLDRPAMIGGLAVQGPVSDTAASYINYMPEPVRNGMTLGELAQYMRSEHPGTCNREPQALQAAKKSASEIGRDASEIGRDASEIGRDVSEIGRDFSPGITDPESTRALAPGSADAALTVVPMQNWHRDEFYDQTGVPWINPSPNLRSVAEATLYPGLGMLDATNVSVGRGTATPFEVFGAGATPAIKDSPAQPAWFEGKAVAGYLTARNIPGVSFATTKFTVADDANHYPYHGQTIEGVRLTVTDRAALDSPELGIEILSALCHLYPTQFKLEKAAGLVANTDTMAALAHGDDPRAIAASWTPALAEFKARRAKYLLYP